MPVEVQLFDDLDAVAVAAAGALDRAERASSFDRLSWFRLTRTHCPPGPLLALRAREGSDAAWLFLTEAHGRATAYATWYTLRFDIPGRTPALLAAMAQALRRRVHHLTLAPLDDDSARAIAAAFTRDGWSVVTTRVSANWSIAIPVPDWDAYLAARPKRLRETLRRKGRAQDLTITIHTRFDAQAWADYEAVYRASWKPAEGAFVFLRALAEQEGAAGTLRLGIAHTGGAPVAAQLWLTEHGTATIHKLAHVETAKRGSPGTVLSAAMFRHAIAADRVTRIDFGMGDEPYKADWMDCRRPLYRIDAWNPRTLRGLAGIARARLATLVRRTVKV